MPNAIALRPDLDAPALRGLARRSKDAAQARRLLSLAVIYDGGSRTEAARLGNVTLQIVRDWVVRFNAEGQDGLRDRKAPGPTPLLNAAHRAALLKIIERGPTPSIHGVVCQCCTAPGFLETQSHYSARCRVLSRRVARASSGLR